MDNFFWSFFRQMPCLSLGMSSAPAGQGASPVAQKLAQKAKQVLDSKPSTAHMAGGGNLACAQSIHDLILLDTFGTNKDLSGGKAHIGTLVRDLSNKGLFQKVQYTNPSDIKPGDLVITGDPNASGGGSHIGIALDDGRVANNSSSKKAFVNEKMDQHNGKVISTLYRPTGKTTA